MRTEPVTVVVSRRVKPGKEAEYEAWIKGVTGVALKYEGHLGMNVFRPQAPDEPYVLVYKFDSGEHLDAWLHSDERAAWVREAEALAEESHAEHVTGLESWFTLRGARAMVPPAKWKMALITGVVVLVVGQALGAVVKWAFARAPVAVPDLVVSAVSVALMVSLLTWVVMPQITRILARWLFVRKR